MTNQTYPTLALSKSGYGSKHPFTLSHKAPQSSLSVYADTPQFASAGIIFFIVYIMALLSSASRYGGIIFNHYNRRHLTIVAKWIVD